MFACGAEREEENVGLHGLFHTLAALIIQAEDTDKFFRGRFSTVKCHPISQNYYRVCPVAFWSKSSIFLDQNTKVTGLRLYLYFIQYNSVVFFYSVIFPMHVYFCCVISYQEV